ncbi:hypothetical protein HY338_03025 [Candidatus Gottesmanbacteria bacterium]|nr:hypothetical protein [Candidatus Gottesmanbacteria bacterium]
MKKLLLFLLFLGLLHTRSYKVIAQETPTSSPYPQELIEYNLPYAGLLPDSPIYFIKAVRDQILLWTTRGDIKKANLYLLLADKNLVMGKILWERGNEELSLKTFETGEQYLLSGVLTLQRSINREDLPPGLRDKFELSGRKHEIVLNSIKDLARDERWIQSVETSRNVLHQAMQLNLKLKT